MKPLQKIQHLRSVNATIYQFVKFGVSGTLGAVVDFGIFAFLTRVADWNFLSANLVSVFFAILVTFVINKYWTFQSLDHKQLHKQSVKFFIVATFNYFLQQWILYSIVVYTGAEQYLGSYEDFGAKIVAIGVVMFSNFFANKYWTFRETHSSSTPPEGHESNETANKE